MERVLVKGMYVIGCCTTAAWFTSLFLNASGSTPSDSEWLIGIGGGVMLFVLLMVALWLGTHGKSSASWLTMSFGSWMSMYAMNFLGISPSKPFGVWHVTLFTTLAVFIWGGLRAAVRDQWLVVLKWWMWSFAFVVMLYYWEHS